jgi:hypothetical protein
MLRTELKIASISLAAAAAIASTTLATGLTATIAADTAHAASYSVVGGKIVLDD